MAIEVFTDKVECKVSAQKMWHGAYEDARNCLPKALPHVIAGVEYAASGSSAFQPGSVRILHFHKSLAQQISKNRHPEHLVLYIKEKLEEVDHQALKLKVEVVEGGFLGVLMKHYKYTVQVKEGAHLDTCVVEWSFEYEALSEKHHPHIPAVLKEVVPLSFVGVEAYLLAPHDYEEIEFHGH